VAAFRREAAPAPAREQAAFTRRRAERRPEFSPPEQSIEPRPPLKAPVVARTYDIQPGPRAEYREPARSSRRIYWILAIGILFAFGAGFVTNALWPFAPKSATELLKGEGLSALTANLPSMPARMEPAEPVTQPEPEPAVPAPAPVPQAAPPAAAPPAAAALPPEWNQPSAERPRPAATRSVPAPAPAPVQQAERPVVAPPTPLTPQPAQQAQLPPQQAQVPPRAPSAANPSDVCREGSGAKKPSQDSLSGIAEGFMTDLRNLGRCLNSLAK
jgi:hypothetical protein